MIARFLFLTYHLRLPDEPGDFRPWMEARLIEEAEIEVTVITSGVQYMTGQHIRREARLVHRGSGHLAVTGHRICHTGTLNAGRRLLWLCTKRAKEICSSYPSLGLIRSRCL